MAERDRYPTILPLSRVGDGASERMPAPSGVRAPLLVGSNTEALLPGILEAVPAPILVVDEHLRLVLANAAARRLLGVQETSLLGYSAVRFLSRDKLEQAFAALGGQARYGYRDTVNVFGVERDVQLEGELLTTDRGVFLCLSVQDRTDDDRHVAEWAQFATELPSPRLERAHHLEALGQLTGTLAHDFNNLLAVILGSLETARARLKRGLDPGTDLERALFATERSIDTTAQILRYTRRGVDAEVSVAPEDVVLDFRGLLERAVGSDVELTLVTEATPRIAVEAAHLETALLNLVVNARDAVHEHGDIVVALSCRVVEQIDAEETGLALGRYVILSVSDNGVGMPDEVRSRVFEPFYTTKPPGMGTGLGLSTVSSLMRRLGGAVRLHSEPGRGTTVDLYFPVLPT